MQPTSFADLGVPNDIIAHLGQRGIETAFPIQAATIPDGLAGRDVSGKAPTGSGKTLAFGVPLAVRVKSAGPGLPRALVLAPTRELAAQIHAELAPILRLRHRNSATFYGGVGFGNQLKALRRGVDVAVACPGRLRDLVQRGDLRLDDVEIVVVDEADRMADMGFLPEVRKILDAVRPDRQTLLFSATLDGDVDVLVRHYQRDPVRHEVTPSTEVADLTTHRFVDTTREQRVALTASLVGEHGSTIVFCRTKHGADRLARQLDRAGVVAVAIHGNRNQSQRQRALAAFAAGRAQALVATDVAARGIHVDDVACVVHFDPPADAKDYVHRSGRTGRAGAAGAVVSLVVDADRAKVRKLRQGLGAPGDRAGAAAGNGSRNTSGNGSGNGRGGSHRPRPSRPAGSSGNRRRRGGGGGGAGGGGRRAGQVQGRRGR